MGLNSSQEKGNAAGLWGGRDRSHPGAMLKTWVRSVAWSASPPSGLAGWFEQLPERLALMGRLARLARRNPTMLNDQPTVYCGSDVSKDHLDLVVPGRRPVRLPNTPAGSRAAGASLACARASGARSHRRV